MVLIGFALCLLLVKGDSSQELTLEPKNIDVMENENVTLTCTTHSTVSYWTNSDQNKIWSPLVYDNRQCMVYGFLNNSLSYSWHCHGNGSFSITILHVNETQHNITWRCRSFSFTPTSNKTTVNIRVRVKKVEITTPNGNNITVVENNQTSLRCRTSYSRPTPSINWFMRLKGNVTHINASSSGLLYNERGLVSVISVLNISVNKEKQGAELYCSGTNGFEELLSRSISLEVHYAPNEGPYIDKASNNSIYTLKENSTCSITCAIPWGNPLPNLSWNCSGINNYSSEGKKRVKLNLQWQTKRDEDRFCTCTSMHEVAGIQTTSIRIEVLYPPAIEAIRFSHAELHQSIFVKELIRVKENETFMLTCEARSKPKPTYNWRGISASNSSNITIINRHKKSNYSQTCYATNVMEINSAVEKVTINKSIVVEVLYPPCIITLADKRVIEGSDVEFTCPVTKGNPPETSYLWTRDGDGSKWRNSSFTLRNVSRQDSMSYICTANNLMVMTGNITKIETASKNMSLEVLYPPTKPTLSLVNMTEGDINIRINDTLIVVEHTPFTLTCNASSLPKPNLYSWSTGTTMNDSIIHIPGLLRTDRENITCHVSNVMIPTEGESRIGVNNITIPVKIQFPPGIGNMDNINIEEGNQVNISCPIIYGIPKQTSILWVRKKDERKWQGANVLLQKVSRTDSSIYTCRVNNTMTMTGGFKKEGIVTKGIELNVLYQVFILNYEAVNKSANETFTVAENEQVNLRCDMEGNPIPEGMIYSEVTLDVSKTINENYTTLSTIFTATCLHKGLYTCKGTNIINQERISERNITLYVRCSPREDPKAPLQNSVKTSRDKALTLNFTVIAYPEPTTVLLKKYIDENWISIDDGVNFQITKTGRDIQFTIHRVSEGDFGKYMLTISNGVGNFNYTFSVESLSLESSQTESEPQPVNYGLVIGLPLAILIIITVFITGGILYRKRNTGKPEKLIYQNVPITGHTRKVKKTHETHQSKDAYSEELQEIDDVPHCFTEPTEYFNSPEKIEQIERIKISELFSFVSEKSDESFNTDYQKLPSGIQKPCTFARKPENLPLNRYNGIYPYDHSRVKIPSCPDFFINACYIDGYKRKHTYIASLGPTTKTTNDFQTFWQMVWHEETDVIVMLTNLNEPSGMKCEQYWPPDGSDMDYGDICVKNKSVKVFAEYTARTFDITKNGRKRNLTHLHFTAWPDKTVPEDTTCLLEFRRRIKFSATKSAAPIIVHCSAGIGRTGTLIAIDRLIEEGKDTGSVNVFECVARMRDQRVKMVQTAEQYVYIYKALVNALVFDCETIPIGRFENVFAQNNDAFYKKHFKQLSQSVEKDKKEDADSRATNNRFVKYNRHGADVPGKRFTVMLNLTRQCGDHTYINAVYMNTHEKRNWIITAQTPLPDTVEDFLCMIYNENCTCVVTMEDLQEPGTMIGQYLSEKRQPTSFGNFMVSCSRLETKDQFIVRQMKIKYTGNINSREMVTYHFQYTKWMPGQDTPVSAREFIHFIEKVENYDKEFSENYSHILVHCLKANERSGLFCAVKILKEKISEEEEINVGNVLRHLRTRRQTAITSMEQVKFCYKAVRAFIQMNK